MKRLSSIGKTICVMILGFLTKTLTFAQDSLSNLDANIVTTDFNENPFYFQLWFWIVIGLVFILLLIALLRGGRKRKE